MKTLSPRETFDRQLAELKDQLLILGSMVEQITLDAVDALKCRDTEAARRAYLYDQKINDKRFEIESACITIIATQQPLARDLRLLASVLEVATELERMGDYAKGVARICLLMKDQPPIKPITDLPRMAELATDMLHRALGAFVATDADQAAQITEDDDAVDELYNQINRVLLTYMISDPSTIDRANYLTWAAHNLERMADRVTNICERTIYVATGEMKELDVSDDELNKL
ncbi:MAG TPA: phosphate signaling complex protein PhoU [Anaerolineae bacterium]|nr:phosphate signaling complex protein PhoU [Anaerolineae bacterium]